MQSKSLLYGRRIKGDIGPLNTDPRTNLPGGILAPAVSLNGAEQYYDEISPVQNFSIGSRMVVDERTFHYAKCNAALVAPCTYRLAVTTDQILAVNDLLSVAPAMVVGDKTVTLAVAGFQAGVVAANELVDGWAEIWPVIGGNTQMFRRIVANTAVVAGNFNITVDRPFNIPLGIGSQVTIHPSVYRAVQSAFSAGLAGFQVAVGLPPVPVTINNYFWLQTWGPCCVGPTGGFPLGVADFVDVYLHSDGCINSSLGEVIGTTVSPQRVGYVLGAGNYGTMKIMLQLAP